MMFLGYNDSSKAYCVYNPLKKKLTVSKDANFDETKIFNGSVYFFSKELKELTNSILPNKTAKLTSIETTSTTAQTTNLAKNNVSKDIFKEFVEDQSKRSHQQIDNSIDLELSTNNSNGSSQQIVEGKSTLSPRTLSPSEICNRMRTGSQSNPFTAFCRLLTNYNRQSQTIRNIQQAHSHLQVSHQYMQDIAYNHQIVGEITTREASPST